MIVVEAMVQKTDQRSSETGTVLQQILAAGADEEGHWDLPLVPERRASMQQVRRSMQSSPAVLRAVTAACQPGSRSCWTRTVPARAGRGMPLEQHDSIWAAAQQRSICAGGAGQLWPDR